MVKVTYKGDLHKTNTFLSNMKNRKYLKGLEVYAQEGVNALREATPKDTGATASSWEYSIKETKTGYSINWINKAEADGIPIVILLEYGHVTKNGGYVLGREFINPALAPIFDKIAEEAWKGVTKQ